jgi:glycine cleavage system H protein
MATRIYTDTHEWIDQEGETVRIGISSFARHELGEIVYVGLPQEGEEIDEGAELCVLESLKAAADVYAPAKLTVLKVNDALKQNPNLLNEDPEGQGWLLKARLAEDLKGPHLLDSATYLSFVQ